jgi:Ca2+-binding RTX toxin-like protein
LRKPSSSKSEGRPALDDSRPPAVARHLALVVAAIALGLWLLGPGAGSAQAGFILVDGSALVFNNLDEPDRAMDVRISEATIEDQDWLVVESVGDKLFVPTGFSAPCFYLDPPPDLDTVICEPAGLKSLTAASGSGEDRIAVTSSLPATLCGGDAHDILSGGSGDDLVSGAGGDDELSGGEGDDILRGDRIDSPSAIAQCSAAPGSPPGVNTLLGGPGNDLLAGDGGRDTLVGGAGDDYAFGRSGDDQIEGGDGDDAVVGLDGSDTLDGGSGSDVLSGGPGRDRMLGGDGKDDLGVPIVLKIDSTGPEETSIELGDDEMRGGADDDRLFAGAGDRTLNYNLDSPKRAGGRGANGADVLSGGSGSDLVSYVKREIPVATSLDGRPDDGSAGEGDDIAADVERITGGTADDVIDGGSANDVLDGGPGSDRLHGLDGADVLEGGPVDGAADFLSGGTGPDSLSGGPGADSLAGDDGDDRLRGGGGSDRLDGGAGADTLAGEADGDDLAGGPGRDVIDGGPGVDRADYADAAAAVTVRLDDARNDGERGEDWVRHTENVRGGPGADNLFGDAGVNAIEGGPGHDLIDAGAGTDTVRAGPGRDAVLARDDARDTIACGAGRDVAVVDELDAIRRGGESCERSDRGRGARRGEALLRPACQMNVRLPGAARELPLRQRLSIPRGTRVRAGRCAARLSTGRRAPRVSAAGGAFALRRPGSRRNALALALAGPSFSTCRAAPASRQVRALGIRARRGVRLIGRYATTFGVGASWRLEDRCGSTVTRVRRGAVRVTDRGDRRSVVVRARHVRVSKPRRRG